MACWPRNPARAISAASSRQPALVNGDTGIVVAPHGQLPLVLLVTVAGDQVAGYELVAGPARLAQLEVAVLGK